VFVGVVVERTSLSLLGPLEMAHHKKVRVAKKSPQDVNDFSFFFAIDSFCAPLSFCLPKSFGA